MIIEIERESDDRLSRKTWNIYIGSDYYISSLNMLFDSYYECSRKTTRHKYVVNKIWHRIDSRHCSFTDKEVMTLISQDIIKEAKDILKEKIDKMIVGV